MLFRSIGFLLIPLLLLGAKEPILDCQDLWRKVGGNLRKSVTSNTHHFWRWAKGNAEEHLGPYLHARGSVMGDTHLRNVFDYRSGGKAKLAIADVDDGGEGPLYLDLARYVVYLEAAGTDLKIGKVFDSYVAGLRGEKIPMPKLMKEARDASAADIEAQHLRYVEKNSKNGKFRYKDLDLTPLEGLNPAQQAAARSLGKDALAMSGASKVWDLGYTTTDSGSSAGMARYWILVGDKNGPTSIMEAKELGDPALAQLGKQPGHAKRVAEISEHYTEAGFDPAHFGVKKAGGSEFWMRPRKFQMLDLNDPDISDKQREEFAVYLAGWMGEKHGSQAAGPALLRSIEQDERAAKEALESFARTYLKKIEKI